MSEALARWREDAARQSAGRSDSPIGDVALDRLLGECIGGVALDFGAGAGVLTRRLAQSRAFERVVAIDLVSFDGQTEGHGVKWLRGDLNDPIPAASGSFSAVLAVEVIEHLENPRAVAREWFRVLRPGGVLVATMPNNESWRSLISLVFRGHHVAFADATYPAHLTALLRSDVRRVMREAGFREPTFFSSGDGCLPKLTAVRWRQVSCGLLRGFRYSDNIGWVALKPR